MAQTKVELDEEACAQVMRRHQLPTKTQAINLALRQLAAQPAPHLPPANAMTLEEALAMRGTGWDGDLNAMRSGCCRDLG